MTHKIYIIDAVNYLFRSYYAIGPMTNEKGESTSALYGFIRSVQKLIKMFSPEHLVCVFDGPDNKKARREIYTEYKAHRKEAPLDLIPQIDLAKEYCKHTGISTLCIEGFEADDVMATIGVWAEKNEMQAYLCTTDKDLCQLISSHIFVLHPHKEYALIDRQKVEEIYGVKPNQIRDYLAITGDTSDNIPGIKGFGPKTAADLLQKFGTLQHILDHPEKIEGEKKQKTILENKEIALVSQKLASLNLDTPIPKDIFFYKIANPHPEDLHQFYERMHFRSLLKEMVIAKEEKPTFQPQKKYHLIQTKEEIESLFEKINSKPEIGIDTETTSTNPFLAKLVGISFCIEPGEAWYIPCNNELSTQRLKTFFEHTKSSFFGHNIKYDEHVLQNHHISIPSISFDTMIASYLLHPEHRRHNLDELTLEKLEHQKIPIETLIGKGKSQISMQEVPLPQICDYACEDIDYTTRLKNLFEKELEKICSGGNQIITVNEIFN